MAEAKKPTLDAPREIGRAELHQQGAVYFLGLLAARSLDTLGQVTFIMTEDDKVAVANPVHVYLDSKAVVTDEGQALPPYRWVRPVLGSGKPQYVAWKDGELWEIEFEEPYEPQQAQGNEPHQ